MLTRAADPWDDVDRLILAACQTPRTLPELAETSGLPAETVKSQLHAFTTAGQVFSHPDGGVRYQLTLTGRARLTALARPAQPAIAMKAA